LILDLLQKGFNPNIGINLGFRWKYTDLDDDGGVEFSDQKYF
jgi:hypothetical protein